MEGKWISLCEDLVFIIWFHFLFISSVYNLEEQAFFSPLSFTCICITKMSRKYVHMFSSSQISMVNFQPSEYTIDSVGSWPWLCLVKAGLDGLEGFFQPQWFHNSTGFVVSPLRVLWAALAAALCWYQTQKLGVRFSSSTGPALKPEILARKTPTDQTNQTN